MTTPHNPFQPGSGQPDGPTQAFPPQQPHLQQPMLQQPHHQQVPGPPRRTSRLWWLLAVPLVALVVLAAVLLWPGSDGDSDDGTDAASSTGSSTGSSPSGATRTSHDTRFSCTTVIHIGDLSSAGMFDAADLDDPTRTADDEYRAHGAANVISRTEGPRSTTEGTDDGVQSAVDIVRDLLPGHSGTDTCWVIATGTNDAANWSVGNGPAPGDRVRTMLDLLRGRKVLWVTAASGRPDTAWEQAGQEAFNAALKDTVSSYPTVAVYDWAGELSPVWFKSGDYEQGGGVHYTMTGNTQRALRIPAALANAFPAGVSGSDASASVVGSGYGAEGTGDAGDTRDTEVGAGADRGTGGTGDGSGGGAGTGSTDSSGSGTTAHGGLDVGPAGDGSGAVSPNGKTIESCMIGSATYSGGAVYTDGTSATRDPVCDRLRDEFYAERPWICNGSDMSTDDPSRCPGGEARSAYDPELWGGGTGMPDRI